MVTGVNSNSVTNGPVRIVTNDPSSALVNEIKIVTETCAARLIQCRSHLAKLVPLYINNYTWLHFSQYTNGTMTFTAQKT